MIASAKTTLSRGLVFHKPNVKEYCLHNQVYTLVIFEIFSGFEVEIIISKHSEDFKLIIGGCDMCGCIEGCIDKKELYFSLQLMLMLSFLSFFSATSTLPLAHRLMNSS